MTDVTPFPKRTLELDVGGGRPLRRGKPVNQESARRRDQRERRADCRALVLARDGSCVFHRIAARNGAPSRCEGATRPQGWSLGLEVHEVVTRARAGNPLDPDNCVALCPWANNEVDERQAGAEVLGLLLPSWATRTHEVEAQAIRDALARPGGDLVDRIGFPSWRRYSFGDFPARTERDLKTWGFSW